MVGFLEEDAGQRTERFFGLLRESGAGGEETDLRWMARLLSDAASVLDPAGEDVEAERLLAAAHLAGVNEGEAAGRLLKQYGLAAGTVRGLRELLRAEALSPEGWQLLRLGVCRVVRRGGQGMPRLEIEGRMLGEVSAVWHELGDRLVFRRLVGAFRGWLSFWEGDVEVVIRRAPGGKGPEWARELRAVLAQSLPGCRVMPMVAWDAAEGVTGVRSECRRGA